MDVSQPAMIASSRARMAQWDENMRRAGEGETLDVKIMACSVEWEQRLINPGGLGLFLED